MKFITKSFIKTVVLGVFVACVLITSHANAQSKESNIHYLTDTAVDFNGLISKFKGKVIYVDIWATWCSPCRHELQVRKDIEDFRDFASKNDIVILYICCDKDGKGWKPFITANKLAGYHILVNTHLDKDFHTTFSTVQKRNGVMKRSFYIPRHIIIDENGMVADSSVDSQGSASVYARLKKLLNE